MTSYFISYYEKLFSAIWEHMVLVIFSVLIAMAIAFALSVHISRWKKLTAPILVALEILYTVPSMAMFAFLIPLTGLGEKTAIAALSVYALVFLARNTLTGFSRIDPVVLESALALGMTSWEKLLRVEFPLAMPHIIAGVRLATVSTIGIASIAYAVGAGGIGRILFEGLRQMSEVKIYWGVILVALLALAANYGFVALERKAAERARR